MGHDALAVSRAISRVSDHGAITALHAAGVDFTAGELALLTPAFAALIEGLSVGESTSDALVVGVLAGLEMAGSRNPV